MSKQFDNFLAKHKSGETDVPNILGMNGGKWSIPENSYREFLQLYSKAWTQKPYYLVERRRALFPFVLDIDLDAPITDEVNVIVIANKINDYMGQHDMSSDHSVDGVLYATTESFDRLHIIYPNYKVDVRQSMHIMEALTKHLQEQFPSYKKPWSQVVDPALSYQQLRMIGSHKWCHKSKTDIERIYYPAMISNDDVELQDEITTDHMFTYSLYLNSSGDIVTGKPREEAIIQVATTATQISPTPVKFNMVNGDKISKLLSMLSPSRADNHGQWIEVGMCLKNISENNVGLWDEWSKQSQKYSDGECLRIWKGFKNTTKPLTMGSLCYWAKHDSPDMYHDLQYNDLKVLMKKSLNETETDVAMVFKEMFIDKYKFVEMKQGSAWYKFENHRWRMCPTGSSVRNDLSGPLVKAYLKEINSYSELAMNCDEDKQKEYLNAIKGFNAIILKLKKSTYKANAEKACKDLMGIPCKDFINVLDSNPYLIGCENGIIDLTNGCEFRDGNPEDMVSLSCGLYYSDKVDVGIREKLMGFMRSIMPNEAMVAFLLKELAYQLSGNRYREKISFWVGIGSNGKGVLASLVKAVFGEYFYSPDVSLVTTKKTSSSAANSEMAKARGVRVMNMTEPSEDDKLQVGKLKAMSGGDMIQARALYMDFVEYKPQYHMTLQMNNKPATNGFDLGFARRPELTVFPHKFCDNPQLSFERLADRNIKREFETNVDFHLQFLLILLEYYQQYIHGNQVIDEPDEVKQATKEYLDSINLVGNFIIENYEVTKNPEDIQLFGNVYDCFKEYQKGSSLGRPQFSQQMNMNGFGPIKIQVRDSPHYNKTVVMGLKGKLNYMSIQDDDLE